LFTTHTFPGDGSYVVRASIPQGASWKQTIKVDRPFYANAESWGDGFMHIDTSGGQGTILRAAWTFDDGTHAEGMVVPEHGPGSLVVTDGAGNTATANF